VLSVVHEILSPYSILRRMYETGRPNLYGVYTKAV
jgi:hypothetical protein